MVMKNMQYYNALLLSGTPLFVVGVLLSPPEISLHPHAHELFNMMMQAVIDIVEGWDQSFMYMYNPSANINSCCKYRIALNFRGV